jgi:hypothetical protein
VIKGGYTAIFIIIVTSFCVLSIVGIIGVHLKNKNIINTYARIQIITTIFSILVSIVFIWRWCGFSGVSFLGINTYYEQEWPNLMRYVHASEF